MYKNNYKDNKSTNKDCRNTKSTTKIIEVQTNTKIIEIEILDYKPSPADEATPLRTPVIVSTKSFFSLLPVYCVDAIINNYLH